MEGVAAEAASLAGHLGLGKLICLYDCNSISLAATVNLTFTEDVAKRFEAYGWHVVQVADGNDPNAVADAIAAAKAVEDKPSLLVVRTNIGFGQPQAGHLRGARLAAQRRRGALRRNSISAILRSNRSTCPTRQWPISGWPSSVASSAEAEWQGRFEAYVQAYPDLAAEWQRVLAGDLPAGWDARRPHLRTRRQADRDARRRR